MAIILLVHPLYDLLHWADVSVVDTELETIGAPGGGAFALMVMLIQVAASLALLVRRLLVRRLMRPALVLHLVLLLATRLLRGGECGAASEVTALERETK